MAAIVELQETEMQEPRQLRFVQVMNAQYEWHGEIRNCLYGLSDDGAVYKFEFTAGGWVRMPMVEAIAVPYTYNKRRRAQDQDEDY